MSRLSIYGNKIFSGTDRGKDCVSLHYTLFLVTLLVEL